MNKIHLLFLATLFISYASTAQENMLTKVKTLGAVCPLIRLKKDSL